MAKKNDSTPQSDPGLASKATDFLDLFNSCAPAEQAAFLAKVSDTKRTLITHGLP